MSSIYLELWTRGRGLIATKNKGFLGLVVIVSYPGDINAIFIENDRPVVVRPVLNTGGILWLVDGECFINGIREGETW